MEIRALAPADADALQRFLRQIPEGDRTFFKEAVEDPDVVAAWAQPGAARWLAVEGPRMLGYVAVVPLHGWSSHVGEIRLIVDPQRRGAGVGRALARHAILEALALGLSKIVVEVLANQEYTVEMFRSLGFDPEALLTGHVRDRSGQLQDLMILAQSVGDVSASMATAGILGGG